ncbi:MAG: DNA repair protein RadC [Bacteroides sp.]|nr:DNA repair protein RadC [Bacteroides sp.]
MSDSTDLIRLLADEEKPREKALNQGIGALTDAELLAILLRVGIKGKSVLTVAREILRIHDNDLAKLARQTPRALAKMVPGIGPTKAITLIAALELGLRARGAMARSLEQKSLSGSEAIYHYMRARLELLAHEEFWVIILNNKLVPVACERVNQGGIATTMVDLRILFKKVIDHQASTIAVCHNHPSGRLTPSIQDDELTKRISEGAKTLDIRLLDHLIIAPTGFYSYHDQGRL